MFSIHNPSGTQAISAALTVLHTPFAHILNNLLEERGGTRAALYEYIFARGCEIDQTAMYRYFNPNERVTRLPSGKKGDLFLACFGEYLHLNEAEYAALILIWQVQRRQKRKNGAGKIMIVA